MRINEYFLSLIKFCLIIGFIFSVNSTYGNNTQQMEISGIVRDASGIPLIGANVIVKDKAIGAITDFDGQYVIKNISKGDVLVFSLMGMETKEILIEDQTVIDVVLVEDIQQLNEIVIVGYTSTSKKNVASSIAKVNSEDISALTTTDVRQALQGRLAGVNVVNNNGDPGASSRIIIRGLGSFTNSEPLYVIDGIQGGDINSVSQQDIESVTVLKDAATTAIYGSAGANGVVIISTKRGKEGEIKISYDSSYGISTVNQRYDMLNAREYIDLVRDIQETNGLTLTDRLMSPDVLIDRTDWQDEILRSAFFTDHSFRLSGGTDKVDYAFSTSYKNHESTVIDRKFERLTMGMKLNEKLFNNKLRLSQNIRIRNDVNNGIMASFIDALRMPTYLGVYDSDNLGGYTRTDKVTDLNDANNPLNEVNNTDFKDRSLSVNVELTGELDLYDGLIFKTQARLSGGNTYANEFEHPSQKGNGIQESAVLFETYNYFYNFFLENFFNYNKSLENHSFNVTLGNSYDPAGTFRQVQLSGSDFTSDAINNISLANTSTITRAFVNSSKSRLSYFGKLDYTFKDKYILNVSARTDGSSVFGKENQWGKFYGLGAAWTVTNEKFMEDVESISYLKLRASYGKTGNDNISPFLTTANIWKGWSNNIVYSFGDGDAFYSGTTSNSIGNSYLKWEETTQLDLGFDLGLFNNRVDVVIDYYKRNNDDLLIETLLPLSTGLGLPGQNGTQWVNAASMENTGLEFSLTYHSNNSNKLKWDFSANLTYNENEVTKLGTLGDTPISKGEFVDGVGNTTRTDIGHPIGSFYGYKVNNVAVNQEEVDNLNAQAFDATNGEVAEYMQGLKPGDFIWKDIDGNGYIDNNDRTYIGNPSPKWQYGATINLEYNNFDFQIFLQGIAGVEVVNGGRYWLEGMSRPFNSSSEVLNRWKQEGDVASLPRAGQNSGTNLTFSDWYVEDGSYLRFKNISLGYTIPKHMLDNVFDKLRIYVAVQNAFTFTNYSGYDPEISTFTANSSDSQIFARGIDYFNRPNPTTYRFGIQLNF